MIFPIDNGQVIGSRSTRAVGGNAQAITTEVESISLFSFSSSNLSADLVGTNESVQKLSVKLDDNMLYNVDFTREFLRKSDIIETNVSIPKSNFAVLGTIPLGFDSTQYSLSFINNTQDTCFLIYSTIIQRNIVTALEKSGRVKLYSFIRINTQINKDLGEDLRNYLTEIIIKRRDSLGQLKIIYERNQSNPTQRSEWVYRYTIPALSSSYPNLLPQAEYYLSIP